jgi:hypothetical protein
MKETEYARKRRHQEVIAKTLQNSQHRQQNSRDIYYLSYEIAEALVADDRAEEARDGEERSNALQSLVTAIREDSLVGRGSCSVVDECMEDEELIKLLEVQNCRHEHMAVAHARDIQENYLERALDCRFGEDTDPQLIAWNEWKEKRKGAA